MPRRPAQIVQADIARIIRAAKHGDRSPLRIPLSAGNAVVDDLMAAYLASRDNFTVPLQPTYLYRHFETDDRLLHVGISRDVWKRQSDYANKSHWYDRVARVETECFPNRWDPVVAELEAISNERPERNVAGRVAA